MGSPARRRLPRRGGEHDGEHQGHRDGARGDPQNEGHRDNANPDAAGEHEGPRDGVRTRRRPAQRLGQVFRDAVGAGGCKTGSASTCSSTTPQHGPQEWPTTPPRHPKVDPMEPATVGSTESAPPIAPPSRQPAPASRCRWARQQAPHQRVRAYVFGLRRPVHPNDCNEQIAPITEQKRTRFQTLACDPSRPRQIAHPPEIDRDRTAIRAIGLRSVADPNRSRTATLLFRRTRGLRSVASL